MNSKDLNMSTLRPEYEAQVFCPVSQLATFSSLLELIVQQSIPRDASTMAAYFRLFDLPPELQNRIVILAVKKDRPMAPLTRQVRQFEDIYDDCRTTADLEVPSLAHVGRSSRKLCLDYFYSEIVSKSCSIQTP
jgi:hypothetical protein